MVAGRIEDGAERLYIRDENGGPADLIINDATIMPGPVGAPARVHLTIKEGLFLKLSNEFHEAYLKFKRLQEHRLNISKIAHGI